MQPFPAFCTQGGRQACGCSAFGSRWPSPSKGSPGLRPPSPTQRCSHTTSLLSQGTPSPAHWALGLWGRGIEPHVSVAGTPHVVTCLPLSLQVAALEGTWTHSTTVSLVPLLRALSRLLLPRWVPSPASPGCELPSPGTGVGVCQLGCRKGARNSPIPASPSPDYETVRKGGLIFAGLAFVVGLIIILSKWSYLMLGCRGYILPEPCFPVGGPSPLCRPWRRSESPLFPFPSPPFLSPPHPWLDVGPSNALIKGGILG